MLPSPIWPLAEHASLGQNCLDASIGSVWFCIPYSMPHERLFFQVLLPFSPVSGVVPFLPPISMWGRAKINVVQQESLLRQSLKGNSCCCHDARLWF
jgi:hypothetical protein